MVFDTHACELNGFTDLGDINNDLNRLEQQCQSNPVGTVASHVLLFMVRGLFTSVKFPYAHFTTKRLTADTLFPIVWEVVEHLEASGLNVIAFTSDGASANRKFYNMHRKKTELVYRTENPYRKGHSIFFFSDVPHLKKKNSQMLVQFLYLQGVQSLMGMLITLTQYIYIYIQTSVCMASISVGTILSRYLKKPSLHPVSV